MASTQGGYDQILNKMMARAQAQNIKFNSDKIQFMVKSQKYTRHSFSLQVIWPYDSKAEAIANMKPLQEKTLQRMLQRMITEDARDD